VNLLAINQAIALRNSRCRWSSMLMQLH